MQIEVGRVSVEMIEPDCGVCRHEMNGGFEVRTRRVFSDLVIAGQVVLDIGAYTGLYAIAAAKMGAIVHAFEPMEPARKRMGKNIAINSAALSVYSIALSDTDGYARMRHNPRVAITSGASLVGSGPGQEKVPVAQLDSLAIGRVDLMKIDVERAEPMVIRGAAVTIHRWRPVIIAEVLDPALGQEIKALLPRYEVDEIMDGSNWLFYPC